jgi:hypothetical protein
MRNMPFKSKQQKIEYDKKRYSENKKSFLEKSKEYYQNNKVARLKSSKDYYEQNKEKIKSRVHKYNKENKEKIAVRKKNYYNTTTKKRLETEPELKIKFNLRKRVWQSIKTQGTFKRKATLELLGCENISIVRQHIENQFKKGMCWENYGQWHIDHIYPVSKFDLTNLEEQKKAFNYKNLQPLWAKENLQKGAKVNQ